MIFRCLLTCLAMVFILSACDDLNDIHQKYLDEKPTAYLGIADSLKTYGGKGRVKLTWTNNADPRVVKTIIYWNDRESSVSKDFQRTMPGAQKDSIIIDLPEGTYTFEVVNLNEAGEYSLVQEIQGRSYGPVYEGSLRVRTISKITYIADTVRVKWNTWQNPTYMGTELYYKTLTGKDTTIFVINDDETTDLLSISAEDTIYITSLHRPLNVMDTLRSQTREYVLPEMPPTRIPLGRWNVVNAEGKRMEYDKNKVFLKDAVYNTTGSSIDKIISLVTIGNDSVFYIDRFGSFAAYTTPKEVQCMKMTVRYDNTITVEGYSYPGTNTGYTIHDSDVTSEISRYDPETNTIFLYTMRIITENHPTTPLDRTVFEEILRFKE